MIQTQYVSEFVDDGNLPSTARFGSSYRVLAVEPEDPLPRHKERGMEPAGGDSHAANLEVGIPRLTNRQTATKVGAKHVTRGPPPIQSAKVPRRQVESVVPVLGDKLQDLLLPAVPIQSPGHDLRHGHV